MSQRKFSIITINYNNKEGLRKTIESVVGQSFRDFEYIIIDGGSTDGSIEVINTLVDALPISPRLSHTTPTARHML